LPVQQLVAIVAQLKMLLQLQLLVRQVKRLQQQAQPKEGRPNVGAS
jgi:hypothetical protein